MSDSKQKNFDQEAEDSARPAERFLATDRDVVPMPVETDAPTAWAEFQMFSTITMKAICDNTEAESAEPPFASTSAEVDIELTTESIIEGWTVEKVVARATTDNRVTYYRAFGIEAVGRKTLYEKPWSHWRDSVLAELSVPHPDLPAKVTRMEIMRYGHAMSTPVAGVRSSLALRALQGTLPAPWQRLHFAHSDLSGYSVFEEAFTQGNRRGMNLGLV